MFTEQNLRKILTNWDIPQNLPILDIYIFDGAKVSGSVWTIGEDYILKIAERESLLKNLAVAKALVSQGFAASVPVITKTGAEYLDGERVTVLTRGIKGNPLSKADRFGANRAAFGYKYGESIARLHNALAAIETSIEAEDFDQYARIVDWALPETKKLNLQCNLGLSDSFFDDYTANFGELYPKLPKQLIHRDPNPSNILFADGEVSGFIDFDLSQRNIRLFDPCYCATGILSEWRGVDDIHEKWPSILQGILQGYDAVNPLTAEEKRSVHYVLCTIQMIFVAWLETQEGDAFSELAATNREMLQFIADNRDRVVSIFA